MNLEEIVKGLGGIALIVGGVAGITLIMGGALSPLVHSVAGTAKRKREEQKEFVKKWNLIDYYHLRNEEDISLYRIGQLAKIFENPSQRGYDEKDLPTTLEDYIPEIAQESGYFKSDSTETDAFRRFLGDERTKAWLTDPDYVISDNEFNRKTSYFAHLVDTYKGLGTIIGSLILRKNWHILKGKEAIINSYYI
ncbi:hypothetical protein HYV89_00935 [Candidatus Woesearchaeota archaeon]|nr:hypothetical protein [Candidatus Woesearchaeota archaeon]